MSNPTDGISAAPSTPCIVVDTNVWVENRLLRTLLAAAFLHTAHRLGAVIGLPEVIEQEVIENTGVIGVEAVKKSTQPSEPSQILSALGMPTQCRPAKSLSELRATA